MVDKDRILENYVDPDLTVEYLFIEKADKQFKPINDDQGYLFGFTNIFLTGQFKNDNLSAFKNSLLDELNLCVNEYNYFKSNEVKLSDYKFGLVDNYKNITELEEMDEKFYDTLKLSLRNLLIVGKNFDLEGFKVHTIFDDWFDKYSNKI